MALRIFNVTTSWLLIGALLGLGVGLWQPVHAESGSSQAVMSLIVPANETNTMLNATGGLNNSASTAYSSDTTVSVLQNSDGIVYQVWMAI